MTTGAFCRPGAAATYRWTSITCFGLARKLLWPEETETLRTRLDPITPSATASPSTQPTALRNRHDLGTLPEP